MLRKNFATNYLNIKDILISAEIATSLYGRMNFGDTNGAKGIGFSSGRWWISKNWLITGFCCVGDAKQSIYRFRGAEVSVFADVCKDIEKNRGKNVTLADNFRSSPEILEVCNEVFKDLMGYDENSAIVYEELKPNRETQAKPKFIIIAAEKDRRKAE
jgi:superfamily I DNA/RNA helicase